MRIKEPSPDPAQQKLEAVDYAVAAQLIEGLPVAVEDVEIMRRAARGEITDDEATALIIKKYRVETR